jgi:hypothetical protein
MIYSKWMLYPITNWFERMTNEVKTDLNKNALVYATCRQI